MWPPKEHEEETVTNYNCTTVLVRPKGGERGLGEGKNKVQGIMTKLCMEQSMLDPQSSGQILLTMSQEKGSLTSDQS